MIGVAAHRKSTLLRDSSLNECCRRRNMGRDLLEDVKRIQRAASSAS